MRFAAGRAVLFAAAAACCAPTAAEDKPPVAVVAVVIDDLGNDLAEGRAAAELPGAVACAILPHTAHAAQIAYLAHAQAKEVLLHLPMESVDDAPLGPGAVTLDMDETEIKSTVTDDLASLPHVVGVNNHEGSLISQHPGDLAWIMQAVHGAGKYFYLDSYTTADSIAYQIARENGLAAARRNVFLDDQNSEDYVRGEWQRLLKMAKERGFALAIGHPRPATLAVLKQEIPALAAEGIELVPVARIVALQEAHPLPWPASAAPAPPVGR